MRLVDTENHDKLLKFAAQAVMRYGNRDVKLWIDLENAVIQSQMEICGKDTMIDLAPALEECHT